LELEDAIRARRQVGFFYDGLPRVVQPATLGMGSSGKTLLRGCLVGGASRRNSIPCWELFSVDKIQGFEVYDESFEAFALPDYTGGDSAFASIVCEH
jgi:hypothetical protein